MSSPSDRRIAVIGMGNPLMSDEGIGVRVVARLQETPLAATVDVLDMGTSGMGVLHELEGRDRAVFVDCAVMGAAPGTIRRFTPDEVVSRKVQARLSLHEGDLLSVLALARRLGTCPDEVVIFGIEPEVVDFGDQLSPELSDELDTYVATIDAEVRSLMGRGSASAVRSPGAAPGGRM